MQWLDLDDSAGAASSPLRWPRTPSPRTRFYRYQYFDDNCSTRVRDAIDRALGGGLRRQIEGRSHGSTFRSEAVRLASPAWWMWLGFDIGLGPAADQPLPVWNESFVPMRLADALREAQNGARPSAGPRRPAHAAAPLPPEPQDGPPRWWPWALAGIALGIARSGSAAAGRARWRPIALPFWLLSGVLGALMLFIWFGTAHRYGWANHNLLLLSPLSWLLLPGAWRVLRGRDPGPVVPALAGADRRRRGGGAVPVLAAGVASAQRALDRRCCCRSSSACCRRSASADSCGRASAPTAGRG